MIDEKQIRLWWQIFRPDNALEEVRLLSSVGGTISGYFTDVDTVIRELRAYADTDKFSVYFIMNEIHSGCKYKKQQNKLTYVGKGQTTDNGQIVRRRWLLIDIDPEKWIDGMKYSDVNSSDEELQGARKVTRTVYDYLNGMGFPSPVTTLSGNGIHLYYRIDEPNDKETNELIDNFLKSLDQKFSVEHVGIDTSVGTPGRLSKLYGTVPHKGLDTPERPCRMAKIEYVPQEIVTVPRKLIQKVADEYKDPEKELKELRELQRQQGNFQITNFPKISVEQFLIDNGIEYKHPVYDSKRGAMRFDLIHCPWEADHSTTNKPGDAAVWEYPSGHKDFTCFHGHCENREWNDFWQLYNPNLYKDAWKEQNKDLLLKKPTQQQNTSQVKQDDSARNTIKGNIVEEDKEKGKKWLSTSDVKMFDPKTASFIKSGIRPLDTSMGGFAKGEVTLLSGGSGTGKSSWLNTLIANAMDQGEKVALWSRELLEGREVLWLMCVLAGRDRVIVDNTGKGISTVEESTKQIIDKWTEGKFYLYNNAYPPKWRQLANDLLEPIKKGCTLIILDNLFTMELSDFGGDKYENQTSLAIALCEMAKKYGIHIIFVAHPRKLTGYIRKVDISGTADLTNAVDNVLILHRNSMDFKKAFDEYFKGAENRKDYQASSRYEGYESVMEIAKNRFMGALDIIFGMNFDPVSKRFQNTKEEYRRYGWERPPEQATLSFEEQPEQIIPQVGQPVSDDPFDQSNEDTDLPF